jgi:mRNA-degrading endonuclease RelE of RelBE toxin-antitoxin system
MSDKPFIQVEASATFNRNLRTLAKKYRNIRNDIQPVIEQLEQGELPGEQISGIGYEVFKLRVRNSDIQKVRVVATVSFIMSKQQRELFY